MTPSDIIALSLACLWCGAWGLVCVIRARRAGQAGPAKIAANVARAQAVIATEAARIAECAALRAQEAAIDTDKAADKIAEALATLHKAPETVRKSAAEDAARRGGA